MKWVELHCHSAYSFLDGASDPAELAAAAADHGQEALALTDHDNVCGAMEFAHACRGLGVRPIHGVELRVELETPRPGPRVLSRRDPPPLRYGNVLGVGAPAAAPAGGAVMAHVTLLVESAKGWSNLARLITKAHEGTRPKEGREPLLPSVPLEELERHAEGLVCLSGCAREGAVAGHWERGDPAGAAALGRRLLGAFGRDRFRVELQRPLWRRDRSRNRWLASLAESLGVPSVATGDAHAHDRSRLALQDALVAVRLGATLDETEGGRRGNLASTLLGPVEATERFRDHPEAVVESARLAERLRFDLTRELGYSYPGAEDPSAHRRLAEFCWVRLEQRYPDHGGQRADAERRLREELELIRGLRLSGFFLLHHDMLELAREVAAEVRDPDSARRLLPPGRGRGSSVS